MKGLFIDLALDVVGMSKAVDTMAMINKTVLLARCLVKVINFDLARSRYVAKELVIFMKSYFVAIGSTHSLLDIWTRKVNQIK